MDKINWVAHIPSETMVMGMKVVVGYTSEWVAVWRVARVLACSDDSAVVHLPERLGDKGPRHC